MKSFYVPTILSLIFFLLGIWTISDYGMNWDGPYRMMRGQAYLHLFLTGQENYNKQESLSPILIKPGEYASRYDFLEGESQLGKRVNLPERPLFEHPQNSSFYQSEVWNGNYFIHKDGPGHPPLPDILAALTNVIFFEKLHILGDIESYQVIYLAISALGVFFVSMFTLNITKSIFASTITGLFLGLSPLFFSESHYNMKDPLQASLFVGSVWVFWLWIKTSKAKWGGVFLLLSILAMEIKWNILFLPVILVIWLFIIRRTTEFKKWFNLTRIAIFSVVALISFFAITILIWPYLWEDPLNRFLEVVGFYKSLGIRQDPLQPPGYIILGFNLYPVVVLFGRIPEVVLLFGVVGIWGVIKKQVAAELKVGYLIILWIAVVILRQIAPGVWFYNGIRQIMEVFPAIAILAGLGCFYTFRLAAGRYKKLNTTLAKSIIIGLLAIVMLLPIIWLHPNENLYFNMFVGGISGADKENFIYNKISYGNILKQAAKWLNEHAEPNANLALIDGPSFALSPVWLRQDISISPYFFSGFEQKGEYLINLPAKDNLATYSYRYMKNFLKPLYVYSVDGVDFLEIYKNDAEHSVRNINRKETTNFKVTPVEFENGYYLLINLASEVKVTGITVFHPHACQSVTSQIIDEAIEFVPKDVEKSFAIEPFALMERKDSGKSVRFVFPGEKAQQIRIFPQNSSSCFSRGIITSIEYLSDDEKL